MVIAAMLAGCAGGVAPRLNAVSVPERSAVEAHLVRGHSWMAGDAKSLDLLYVSDQDVSVFSYPGGKPEGELTSSRIAAGLCSDAKGDVFIVYDGTQDIVEYRHGGTSPINAVSDTGYSPIGCAVDPTTGNLAVSNSCRLSGNECVGDGNVGIYRHAKGVPTYYSDDSWIRSFWFCGYDDAGNLFDDGMYNATGNFTFRFAELPRGKSVFTNITLDRLVYSPGGVQWDGKYVAVGDAKAGGQFASSIHRVRVKGTTGTVVDTMGLQDAETVHQFWIHGTKVVGPNFTTPWWRSNVLIWHYPTGGPPVKSIRGNLRQPYAVTVSFAK